MGSGYIDLRRALRDYLRDQEVTVSDILDLMDEEKEGIMDALAKRVRLSREQRKALERNVSSRDLNLLLFVIQAFYLLNPSGMYKGLMIEPSREDVVSGDMVTYEGCLRILKALKISTDALEDLA
ncbi:MAG: hypothetical protein RMJ07_04650 [Nitrososphaerota archaeon]|nr:hypothetical protein [Candidatus Bathyarchaeota archaeon]MDW8048954.1 hypothetical protein [Nitrososphaerota archaeon]